MPPLHPDRTRARELAERLYAAFVLSERGVFGRTEMLQDGLPAGVRRGSREHLLFITLTATIDYQRDAVQLWGTARAAHEDSATRYLFDLAEVWRRGLAAAREAMKRSGLARKPRRDPRFCHTVAVSFHKKWGGDPRRFLNACRRHAPTVLHRLRTDAHRQGHRLVHDFRYLRGPKISSLWVRMLRNNVGALRDLADVPIPVDVHVRCATLRT